MFVVLYWKYPIGQLLPNLVERGVNELTAEIIFYG